MEHESLDTLILYLTHIFREITKKKKNIKHNFKYNSSTPCASAALSPRQYHLIFLMGRAGANSLPELSKITKLNNSGISLMITKLVKARYVYKKYPDSTEDNRKIYYFLTQSGEDALSYMTEEILKSILIFYEALDDAQKRSLIEAINCLKELVREVLPEKTNNSNLIDFSSRDSYLIAEDVLQVVFSWVAMFKKSLSVQNAMNKENNHLTSYNLSDGQCEILSIISTFDIHTIKELSEELSLTQSTLSTKISNLVHGDFLRKEYPDIEDDGRKVYFYLTDKGILVIEEVKTLFRDIFHSYYSSLDDDKKIYLSKGIEHLYNVFK